MDETLKNLVIKSSESLEGEILGEYVEVFKRLVGLTDAKKHSINSYPKEKRKGYPGDGKYVGRLLGKERRDEPGPYRLMAFYFTRKKIYDVHLNDESIIPH